MSCSQFIFFSVFTFFVLTATAFTQMPHCHLAPFKNLVHNCVDFYVQNALKHLRASLIPKIFPGVIPQTATKGEGGREGKGRERREGELCSCKFSFKNPATVPCI